MKLIICLSCTSTILFSQTLCLYYHHIPRQHFLTSEMRRTNALIDLLAERQVQVHDSMWPFSCLLSNACGSFSNAFGAIQYSQVELSKITQVWRGEWPTEQGLAAAITGCTPFANGWYRSKAKGRRCQPWWNWALRTQIWKERRKAVMKK